MTIWVPIVVLATIALGLILKLHQDRKYFYAKTFFVRADNNNLIVKMNLGGHYLISNTVVAQNPKAPAHFAVEEGTYTYTSEKITLAPEKRITADFADAQGLVMNDIKNTHVSDTSTPATELTVTPGRQLTWRNKPLQAMKQGKLVSLKDYQAIVDKKQRPSEAK